MLAEGRMFMSQVCWQTTVKLTFRRMIGIPGRTSFVEVSELWAAACHPQSLWGESLQRALEKAGAALRQMPSSLQELLSAPEEQLLKPFSSPPSLRDPGQGVSAFPPWQLQRTH